MLLFCHYVRNVVMDVMTFPENLYQFYCSALFHTQTRRHIINHIQSKRKTCCNKLTLELFKATFFFPVSRAVQFYH